MTAARAMATTMLLQALDHGGIGRTVYARSIDQLAGRNQSLRAAAANEALRGYARLDAALALALLDDPVAIPVLRRVLDDPSFALTNSCNESAYAALALALLGDTASLDRIRAIPRVNLGASASEIALAILENREPVFPPGPQPPRG